jgi:hypothetical protein
MLLSRKSIQGLLFLALNLSFVFTFIGLVLVMLLLISCIITLCMLLTLQQYESMTLTTSPIEAGNEMDMILLTILLIEAE